MNEVQGCSQAIFTVTMHFRFLSTDDVDRRAKEALSEF